MRCFMGRPLSGLVSVDRVVRLESWRPGCNRCASKVPGGKRYRIEGSDINPDSGLCLTLQSPHQGLVRAGPAGEGNILLCNYNPGPAGFPQERSIKARPVA